MAIRVGRNASGNCVVFYGQTNPVYYNACLSAEITDVNYVSVVNDIASASTQQDVTPQTEYEYYRVHFSEWRDNDNGTFANAQEVVDYINEIGNVTDAPSSGFVFLPDQTMDFIRDETNTSILFSNGDHHGINAVKAIAKENGHVGIIPARGDTELYEIPFANITINGTSAGNTITTVVNNLNALFTLTAMTSPAPAPVYTMEDGQDITWNALETIDPSGNGLYGYDTAHGSYHGSRVYTTETINQPGEYFTFEAKNMVAGGGALMGMGLYSVNDGDLAEITNSGLSNSGHHGYWYSQWLYNYSGYTAPWTTYGSKSSLSYGPGWSYGGNTPMFRYSDVHDAFRGVAPYSHLVGTCLFKVGITDSGFVGVWYYDAELVDISGSYGDRSNGWVLLSRSSTPVPEGEFGLLVKLASTSCQIWSQPKRFATDAAAPTLYYRYAESPDDNFVYPLFASEEEANYVDEFIEGGSGTSHTHQFADDLTGTTWYMPDNGGVHTAPSAPLVPGITYTEIPTEDDPEPLPPAFTDTTITVDELSLVNYQLSPADANYVTTIGGIPNWSIIGGTTLYGIAPEVTGNNVDNPSDTTTVTVYRTNNTGTTAGTLTINITNLTQPVTPIAGYHHEATSTALVDSDTLADGSVVRLQNHIADGERVHFDTTWMTNSMLAALNSVGDGVAKVYMGVLASGADLSSLTEADFDFGVMYYKNGANDYRMRYISGGSFASNTGLGTDGTTFSWELLFANDSTDDTYELTTAPSSLNPENILMQSDGGSWSSFYMTTTLDPGNKDFHIGVTGTTMDISTTGVDEHAIPTPPVTNNMDTNWNKALDFSGSAERTEMVSSSYVHNPMMMAGTNNQVPAPTAGQTVASGHPWATAVVFKHDSASSNQHIWNLGEGTGTNDDNIYLRLSSTQQLYFGWGRDGDYNECQIGFLNSLTWGGIYIASNGARFGDGCTAAQLATAFDIRLLIKKPAGWDFVTPTGFFSSNIAAEPTRWTQVGGRMNRQYQGKLTLGGRGANRSYNGKIASFVTTTLRCGQAMPADAEILEMVTDPMGWLQDYKVGNLYRRPDLTSNSTNFILRNSAQSYNEPRATQVWLMGDGMMDSYSNMIRNQVNPADQNETKMNMISMVSNDIQNVNIPGLT